MYFFSFITNKEDESITKMLSILNDNKIYIKDLPKLLEFNNYSKNSQKLKNGKKKLEKGTPKKKSPKKEKIKYNNNNKIISSYCKLDKFNNKKEKKYEISLKQSHNKNMSNSNNNINGNYLTYKRFKKTSTPSITSGTAFTEKNMNDINQYQNIIIPKVNTVININNNYFEQIDSSTFPMGFYTNNNFNIKNNNNINSNLKKSNTKNNYKNTKFNINQKRKKCGKSNNGLVTADIKNIKKYKKKNLIH